MKNKFLIPAVLVVAVLCFLGAYTVAEFSESGNTVHVYKDGKLIHTCHLSLESHLFTLQIHAFYERQIRRLGQTQFLSARFLSVSMDT